MVNTSHSNFDFDFLAQVVSMKISPASHPSIIFNFDCHLQPLLFNCQLVLCRAEWGWIGRVNTTPWIELIPDPHAITLYKNGSRCPLYHRAAGSVEAHGRVKSHHRSAFISAGWMQKPLLGSDEAFLNARFGLVNCSIQVKIRFAAVGDYLYSGSF